MLTPHVTQTYDQIDHHIIRPHRIRSIDMAWCYKCLDAAWSVLSVGHDSEPYKNGWTDQDAVMTVESWRPKEPHIIWGFRSPLWKQQFLGVSNPLKSSAPITMRPDAIITVAACIIGRVNNKKSSDSHFANTVPPSMTRIFQWRCSKKFRVCAEFVSINQHINHIGILLWNKAS